MRRLHPAVATTTPIRAGLTALAFVTVALGSSAALAQAPAAPLSCEPVERERDDARAALERTRNELEAAQSRAQGADEARASLERAERELAESQASVNSCQGSRQDLCSSVGAFARGLGAGRVQTGGLSECVDSSDQHQLAEQLSGWSNVAAVLSQFGAYSAGETDIAPRMGPVSGSKAEKLMARLFAAGNGSPLVYRRLLIEALELVVPRTWASIKSKPGQVERWFASRDPLDDAIVEEARQGAESRPSEREQAPLTTALELVTAYEMLADCGVATAARDCVRATQLKGMLESSGPLVARRRIQDVWASDCSSVTEVTVLDWLGDLPKASTSVADTQSVASAVRSKLLTCFLRDSTAGSSFSSWLGPKLPEPDRLTTATLDRLHELESTWKAGSPTDVCAHAVRALQNLAPPSECRVPSGFLDGIRPWSSSAAPTDESSFGFGVCDRYARALWAGESATIGDSFPTPPTVDDAVRLIDDAPPTNVHRLRGLCAERVGAGPDFSRSVVELSQVGRALGENAALTPWFIDEAKQRPVEDERALRAAPTGAWLRSFTSKESACSILELSEARCRACRDLPADAHHDCAKLRDIQESWETRTRSLIGKVLLIAGIAALLLWALRVRRAHKKHGVWLAQTEAHLSSLGLEPVEDKLRPVIPSRLSRFLVRLPDVAAWERWGARALIVRAEGGKLQDRDVNRAGVLGQEFGTQLALLVHEENVSPDLGAVRAMLEWAARGGTKAVHVLPIPWSRLKWSRGATDLLELAEESSLRSNPFEVRGRVTSSSQFFDRERLVSGLLASAQAGHFSVVTGLRRFGKSSLALEVARRLPGPSAYVDLAGFHHEIRFSEDPADAADAILRFLCLQLLESARSRTSHDIALEVPEGKMDAATLTAWFRDFMRALRADADGKTPPVLLILDEIEQAIGSAKELDHALDVFAILVGRLRNSLPGTSHEGRERVGVLFASALHPLLWSPLGTLAHQSLVGSFQYVSVPCLPEEAAASMMRGLGARQGIRFKDEALEMLVRESQGVPLLVRRLGSAVLELYDPDRARQGALGAVEIGVEGVRAALEREEAEGSPLRVWIESEIAEPKSPGGAILRALSRAPWLDAKELRSIAARAFREQFDITGVALALTPEEALRRAQEAGGVAIRILGDSGLLRPHGDPTEPEGYELPDGVIRRILSVAND